MLRVLGGNSKLFLVLQGLLACAALQSAAVPARAIDLAPTAPVRALSYDEVANRLYFLDATGALKRLDLTPNCEAAPPCQVSTIVPSFMGQPLNVAVNATTGFGYVTVSAGTLSGGTLWRVNLNGNAPVTPVKIATADLGIPTQIVLAPEINAAYIASTVGQLWRVDLSTGQTSLIAEHLGSTQALVVNAARTLAYGLYAAPVRIVEIDLGTGKPTRTLGTFGQFALGPFSLAWTDSSESALYALIGEFGDSALLRVNLAANTASLMTKFAGAGGLISGDGDGLAVNPSGSSLYVGSHQSVIRFPLSAAPDHSRVFLSIGNIPVTGISQTSGYANTSTTPPDAPFKVVDSPFGGTLDIFGDLTLLINTYHATSYRILVSRSVIPVDPPAPIMASWTAYRWNPASLPLPHYQPVLVAPDATGHYSIPPEYGPPATVPYWSPTYLMMRWPTSDNGLYTLQLQIFRGARDITFRIPTAQQSLTVLVDNTLPVANLQSIRAIDATTPPSVSVIEPCQIVSTPLPNSFDFVLTAYDANGHLLSYSLTAFWGRNRSATVLSDSYSAHVSGAPLWTGVNNDSRPLPPDPYWMATCNCAHTFVLRA
ncbi:MAG TPA: hypothetical protein VGH73_01735, partial [Thermoanaerobaculia bacterium]